LSSSVYLTQSGCVHENQFVLGKDTQGAHNELVNGSSKELQYLNKKWLLGQENKPPKA